MREKRNWRGAAHLVELCDGGLGRREGLRRVGEFEWRVKTNTTQLVQRYTEFYEAKQFVCAFVNCDSICAFW